MANIKDIELEINTALIDKLKWLAEYKAAADEALTYIITHEKDEHAAKLILNALNIGAHNDPG